MKTVYSRPDARAIQARLEKSYPLAPIDNCDFYIQGLHDNYLIKTTKQTYILRLYRHSWRNENEIRFELELLEHLRRQSSPVAAVIKAQDGNPYISLPCAEGDRLAALFSYANGSAPGNHLEPSQATRLGEVFARLHHDADSFSTRQRRNVLDLDFLLEKPLQLVMPFLNTEYRNRLNKLGKELGARLQDLPDEAPFFGPCMGDLNNQNYHVDPQQMITLFDFDQCGYGWRAFDIAKYFSSLHSLQNETEIQSAFLAGYEKQRPLMAIEHENLNAFTKLAHIWVMGIHVENIDLIGRKRLEESFWQRKFATLEAL